MKKNGFTVVELIVSFTLVSIISIILFQLIFSLKDLYVGGDIKTTLLNKQGIMTKKINDDLTERTLLGISGCGVSCLNFAYSDGNSQLLVDVAASTITYDDYTMKLSEGSEFGELDFSNYAISSTPNTSNSFFNLNIPIVSKFFDSDFGIHIVKLYDSSLLYVNNSISLSNATIVANKVSLELKRTTDDNATWAHIFHQENNTYFNSYNSFLKSIDSSKMSSLKSLEVFRSNSKIAELKAQEITGSSTEREIKQINENYQKGYFELIIDYPNYSTGVGILQNYNRWTQTSNFTNNDKLTNSINDGSSYTGTDCRWQNGLKYNNDKSSNSYVNGCPGSYFAIGVNREGASLLGPDKQVNSVDLWVRVDEYIDKYALNTIS